MRHVQLSRNTIETTVSTIPIISLLAAYVKKSRAFLASWLLYPVSG